MVNVMRDITVGVFGNLEITSNLNIGKRVKYNDIVLTGPVINKYCSSFLDCKELVKYFVRDHWTFGSAEDVRMENLGLWYKQDRLDTDGDTISGGECCWDFEQDLCSHL